MQKSIIIASILKPVDDTRMFEKMARSIALKSKYKVFILGFVSSRKPDNKDIAFLPLFNFSRLSFRRIFAPLRLFSVLLKIRPSLLIVNTYELLPVAVIARIFLGFRLIYDIRENYFLNVIHGKSIPKPGRRLIAWLVRLIEVICSGFVDYFLLAEKSYQDELRFVRKNFSVIENKVSESFLMTIPVTRHGNQSKFLLAGTISEEYGIFEAIDFVKAIYDNDPGTLLEIAGYCANQKTWHQVQQRTRNLDFIKITGGNKLVSHQTLLEAIGSADFLLLPYRDLPQIRDCFPTKLYEAAALGCPVLIPSFGIWKPFIQEYTAGLFVDFFNDDPWAVMTAARKTEFYPKGIPKPIYWESIENQFLEIINKQFS